MSDHSATTPLQMQWVTTTDQHGRAQLVARWVVPASVTTAPVAAPATSPSPPHAISHAA